MRDKGIKYYVLLKVCTREVVFYFLAINFSPSCSWIDLLIASMNFWNESEAEWIRSLRNNGWFMRIQPKTIVASGGPHMLILSIFTSCCTTIKLYSSKYFQWNLIFMNLLIHHMNHWASLNFSHGPFECSYRSIELRPYECSPLGYLCQASVFRNDRQILVDTIIVKSIIYLYVA